MKNAREEIYEKISIIFKEIDSEKVWKMWMVVLVGSLFMDIAFLLLPLAISVSENSFWWYVCEILKTFHSYDLSVVVAIAVVIWTFTTSMFVYFLGKADQRHYGIHVIDVFVKGMHVDKIYRIATVIFGEIALLILASVVDYKITLFSLAAFQCYMMLYIISMVLERTSREFTIEQIKNEIKDKYKVEDLRNSRNLDNASIFGSMLHNKEYASHDDVKRLLDILIFYSSNFKEQINEESMADNVRKYINNCSKEVMECMCQNKETMYPMQYIIIEWFKNKNSFVEIKQGILMHIIEEAKMQNYSRIERLLNSEKKEYRELHIWVMVCNIYRQGFEGEAWRECYTKYLMQKIGFGKKNKDIGLALKFWKQITDSDKYYELFQYIF